MCGEHLSEQFRILPVFHAWCTPGTVHVRSWGKHASGGPKARRIEAESCSAHTAKKGPS